MVCVIAGYRSCTNLESHHPSFTVAIEIWGTGVALDQSVVDIFLVVKTVECVHVSIKDQDVLISYDDQVLISVERVYHKRVTEHLREIGFTIEWILGRGCPWLSSHHTVKYESF